MVQDSSHFSGSCPCCGAEAEEPSDLLSSSSKKSYGLCCQCGAILVHTKEFGTREATTADLASLSPFHRIDAKRASAKIRSLRPS